MATLPRNQCCQSQKIKTCRFPSEVARCHSPPYMLPSAWKQVNFDVRGARGVRPGCCAMPPVLLMSLHRLWLSRFNLACLPQNRTGFLAAFAAVLPMVSRWNFTAARPYFWVCGRTNGYPDLYPQCRFGWLWFDLPPGWLQADKTPTKSKSIIDELDVKVIGEDLGIFGAIGPLLDDAWYEYIEHLKKEDASDFWVPSFQTILAPVPEVLVLAFTTWGCPNGPDWLAGCWPHRFPKPPVDRENPVLVGNGWSFEMPKLVSSIGSCVSCMCQLWFWPQFQES